MFNNKVIARIGAGSGIALELAARGARLALPGVGDATLAETMTQILAGVEACSDIVADMDCDLRG